MNKQLREKLGIFLAVTPLRVGDTDPYASDFKVVSGVHDSVIAVVTNYGAGAAIGEETRDEDCEYQERSIREGKAFAQLFAASTDMYEALEAMLEPYKGTEPESFIPSTRDRLKQAIAALAKARGEA
jgi:hypothetical protein